MLTTVADKPREKSAETVELRDRLDCAQGEIERLRQENRALRETLDAYIGRARSVPLYGSHEMTAGTSIGPRRRR